MARVYGIKHLAVAAAIVFGVVLAVDLYRVRDRTGPFRPRAECLRTVQSLGVAARSSGNKRAQDSLVHTTVSDARENGLTGEQPTALAMYMNFAAHSTVFDTTELGVRLLKVVCGDPVTTPTP